MKFFNNALALNVEQFVDSLQYMWKGMLCIFIVIGVIILTVTILNKISNKQAAKKKNDDNN